GQAAKQAIPNPLIAHAAQRLPFRLRRVDSSLPSGYLWFDRATQADIYSPKALAMPNEALVHTIGTDRAQGATSPGESGIVIIFGASGDLTKRLLMPAFYNLACDKLLPNRFAIVGIALDELSTDQFRSRMTADIKKFTTRKQFDDRV